MHIKKRGDECDEEAADITKKILRFVAPDYIALGLGVPKWAKQQVGHEFLERMGLD